MTLRVDFGMWMCPVDPYNSLLREQSVHALTPTSIIVCVCVCGGPCGSIFLVLFPLQSCPFDIKPNLESSPVKHLSLDSSPTASVETMELEQPGTPVPAEEVPENMDTGKLTQRALVKSLPLNGSLALRLAIA